MVGKRTRSPKNRDVGRGDAMDEVEGRSVGNIRPELVNLFKSNPI
jgi:hypothetical protein